MSWRHYIPYYSSMDASELACQLAAEFASFVDVVKVAMELAFVKVAMELTFALQLVVALVLDAVMVAAFDAVTISLALQCLKSPPEHH